MTPDGAADGCSILDVGKRRAALLAAAVVTMAAAGGLAAARATKSTYVFSFRSGLRAAPIGATTAAYRRVFRTAVSLPSWGSPPCVGLAYAVNPTARRTHVPDLLLFCGNTSTISEVHLRSSAFCSSGGVCVGTKGSLRAFAHELDGKASVQTHQECGAGGCSIVAATFGPVHVALRSSNCRTYTRLSQISSSCTASEVLIYRQP